MNRLLLSVLVAMLAAPVGCRDGSAPVAPAATKTARAAAAKDSDVALLLHFAGVEALAKNPDAASQAAMFQLPESRAVRQAALEKLALSATRGWFADTNAAGRFLAPLRPLLVDLSNVESRLAVQSKSGAAADWTLALRLGPARIGAWSNALATAAATLPSSSRNFGSINGALHGEISGGNAGRSIVFQQSGEWLVLGGSTGKPELRDTWLARAKSSGSPTPSLGTNWLRVETGPQFAALLGWPALVDWPRVTAAFSSRTNSVRTDATLAWPTPHGFKPAPWRVPTNSVRDPLVSFTAAQGIAPLFARHAGLRALGLDPAPGQFFTWSRSDVPFQTLCAFPVKDAAARVPGLERGLDALGRASLSTNFVGRILLMADRNEVVWSGLPILVPFVRAAPEAGGDFALGGFMAGIIPQGVNTNPPPRELLGQLTGRANLVYYDWEVTQYRLEQWRQTWQLFGMIAGPRNFMQRHGQAWLGAIERQLGNTITEATVSGPAELSVVRKSHAGFTGIELLLLARWVDNPDFPACMYPPPQFPGMPMMPGK